MSTESRVRIRMPAHFHADQRQSKALDANRDIHKFYGLPAPSDLNQPGVLGSLLDRLLASDQAIDEVNRQLVHLGIATRYQHALDLKNNPETFAAWIKQPRILGLPRPPKKKEDICRALFRATYLNPSNASKRFKRIEFAWMKGEPVEVVVAFLAKRGLQDTKPASGTKEDEEEKLDMGGAKGTSARGDKDASDDESDGCKEVSDVGARKPGPVRIVNAPAALIVGKEVGDFFVFGGYIESIDGGDVVLGKTWHG